MSTIVIWIIALLAAAVVGLFLTELPFVKSVIMSAATIYMCIISFKNYGPLLANEFWEIEVQRAVCFYVIFCFNSTEYAYLREEGSFFNRTYSVQFSPSALINFVVGIGGAALLLLFCDGLLPVMGAPKSFAYAGFVVLAIGWPALVYLFRDIVRIFRGGSQ